MHHKMFIPDIQNGHIRYPIRYLEILLAIFTGGFILDCISYTSRNGTYTLY